MGIKAEITFWFGKRSAKVTARKLGVTVEKVLVVWTAEQKRRERVVDGIMECVR